MSKTISEVLRRLDGPSETRTRERRRHRQRDEGTEGEAMSRHDPEKEAREWAASWHVELGARGRQMLTAALAAIAAAEQQRDEAVGLLRRYREACCAGDAYVMESFGSLDRLCENCRTFARLDSKGKEKP